jgi:hypothetical protein
MVRIFLFVSLRFLATSVVRTSGSLQESSNGTLSRTRANASSSSVQGAVLLPMQLSGSDCSPGTSRCHAGCKNPVTVGSRIFQFFSNSYPKWEDARDHCQKLNLDMASFHTKEESDAAFCLVPPGWDAWIGLKQTNKNAEPEGNWVWIDGSAYDYQNWGLDEPNNLRGTEDCGGFSTTLAAKPSVSRLGQWNDGACEGSTLSGDDPAEAGTGFICATPAPQAPPTPGTPPTPSPVQTPPTPSPPTPPPTQCDRDTRGACSQFGGLCFSETRGDTFCNRGTGTCWCSLSDECAFNRSIALTKGGKWGVCRKHVNETRGEDNALHWAWLVAKDIMIAYGKSLTGSHDYPSEDDKTNESLLSAAGQPTVYQLLNVIAPALHVFLFLHHLL